MFTNLQVFYIQRDCLILLKRVLLGFSPNKGSIFRAWINWQGHWTYCHIGVLKILQPPSSYFNSVVCGHTFLSRLGLMLPVMLVAQGSAWTKNALYSPCASMYLGSVYGPTLGSASVTLPQSYSKMVIYRALFVISRCSVPRTWILGPFALWLSSWSSCQRQA